MNLNHLFEARRNPEINTGDRFGSGVADVAAWATRGRDLFVTFTELPKVGINPLSKYKTPLGVYTYPLDNEMADDIRSNSIPFAGASQWMNVLALTAGESAVRLDDPAGDFQKRNEAVAKWLSSRIPLSRDLSPKPKEPVAMAPEMVEKFIWQYVYPFACKMSPYKTPGGLWWAFTRFAAILSRYFELAPWEGAYYVRDLERVCNEAFECGENKAAKMGYPARWTRIMIATGVEAVIDSGEGIIHSNEPKQAVFFTTRAFSIVDRIANPRRREQMVLSNTRDYGRMLKRMKTPSNVITFINNVLERVMVKAPAQDWYTQTKQPKDTSTQVVPLLVIMKNARSEEAQHVSVLFKPTDAPQGYFDITSRYMATMEPAWRAMLTKQVIAHLRNATETSHIAHELGTTRGVDYAPSTGLWVKLLVGAEGANKTAETVRDKVFALQHGSSKEKAERLAIFCKTFDLPLPAVKSDQDQTQS